MYSSPVRAGDPAGPEKTLGVSAVRSYMLPLSFEANQGQMDEQVKFLARGPRYSLFLTPDATVLGLKGESAGNPTHWLRLVLQGAAADPAIAGEEQLVGRSNYFVGNDPAKWRTNIPTFARVRYQQVYPGVDLTYYGRQGRLENDFELTAGSNPKTISWRVEGADRISIDSTGDLVLSAGGSDVRLQQPRAYQQQGEQQRAIPIRYLVHGQKVGFALGKYDRHQKLVIDPVLIYSTYLGGSGGDAAYSVAVDSAGDAYVTGVTASTNFPATASSYQPTYAGDGDVFVTEFNPDGSGVLFSTYLGGTGLDIPAQIVLDGAGDIFLVGNTASNNFPTTSTAFQSVYGGNQDGFLTEMKPGGSGLTYSTYIGGTQADFANAMAFDSAGDIYVVGSTLSTDFPTKNPIQLANDGLYDAFITEISSTGALIYSTYLGGSSSDYGTGIAVDSAGDVYVSGTTYSTNFPTQSALQGTMGGGSDVFLTKFTPGSSALLFSTYLGGSSIDRSSAMTMDASGNIYLTGDTESHNFPVTPTAYQATLQGTDNAFLAKVTSDGSTLVFSTLLGGSQTDQANALALDIAGNIYITGYTESSNFPHLDPFQNVLGISGAGNCGSTNLVNVPSVICPDAFVAKFGPSGIPTYSSFLGGSNADSGQGIAVDSSGAAYVVGQTFSTNFPTVAGETFSSNSPSVGGAYQWQYLGSSTNSNAFVTKVSPQDAPSVALNPQQIDFGKEPLLSPSTPVAVMLTNVGSAALNISSITASGDFQQTNNCGTSVPGGAGTCTIQITFDPKSVGQQTDQISITEPGSGSTTVTQAITVTGNGVLAGGSLLFSPTTLTFAAQPLGTTSAPQSALLINNGNQPVTITNITVGSGFAQTNTCGSNFPTVPATLNVGQTCTIFVSFSPINTGNVTGSVAIASNAVTTSAALQLAGTGSPVFSLSSNARSSVILIGSKTANFTISAAAPSTLQGAITLGCSTGASCTFSPSAIPPGGSSALTLTGLNASTANPLNFTVTGTSASQGSAAVSITVFFADYSLSASPSGSTVTAGNNATYTITLTPTNGFDQAVLLSCGALPAPSYTTCYWNPGGLSLSGTATASSTLTITTTAQSRLLRRPPPPTIPPGLPRWILFLALLTFLGAIITGYHQSGRGLRTRSTWAVLAMAMVLLALAVGCENYVNPININPSVVGTPSGTFSIVLTGTMGNGSGVSRSTTVNLSVLPNS